MPNATAPRYIPNRGSPDWDAGTEREKELFCQFCDANPQLICRSLDDGTPLTLGGLLIPNPGSRWGYNGAERWNGSNTGGWPRALDHAEFFYHADTRRWVAVGLPNCYGEPCGCIDDLDGSVRNVNEQHQASQARSREEHLVRHISPANHSWYVPDSGRVIIVVASNIVPIYFSPLE